MRLEGQRDPRPSGTREPDHDDLLRKRLLCHATTPSETRYPSHVPFGVSVWEVLILLLVALLLFGPKRLPEMGRSLGKGLREFKDSISGKDSEPDEVPAELPSAPAESRDRDPVG